MIKKYFFIVVLFSYTVNIQAQIFNEDMESYTDGEPISEGHWTEWGCEVGAGCNIMSTSVKAHRGSLSGLIPGDGTTKAVLDLGNLIWGDYNFWFSAYIPSGKEASFSIQNEVPIGGGQSIVGDFLFNPNLETPGVGKITDTALGEVSFNFPHNKWFIIGMIWEMEFDISSAKWEFYVDGEYIIPSGTPFTNENGDYPTALGGIEFYSSSVNNEIYLDDFGFKKPIVLDVEASSAFNFKLYPNPANEFINISSQESINTVAIYNLQGGLVKNISQTTSIDVSNLASGMYFMEVITDSVKSVQKFIKN